jgi:hypothetical protein
LGQYDPQGPRAAEAAVFGAVKVTPPSDESRALARISEQLEELKRLIVLHLLASGVQSTHVGKALGIHPSGISRMLPVREIQNVAAKRAAETDG